MIRAHYKNFYDFWLDVNDRFITPSRFPGDKVKGVSAVSFDNIITFESPYIDADIGKLIFYRSNKWSGLIRTYLDWDQLEFIRRTYRSKIEANISYFGLGMSFKSRKSVNGQCLIGMSFTFVPLRKAQRKEPGSKLGELHVVIFNRVSEVTRRMLVDLIFYRRIIGYVVGEDEIDRWDWKITFVSDILFQSAVFIVAGWDVFNLHGKVIRRLSPDHPGYLGILSRHLRRFLANHLTEDGCKKIKFAQHRRVKLNLVRRLFGGVSFSTPMDKLVLVPPADRVEAWKNWRTIKSGLFNKVTE